MSWIIVFFIFVISNGLILWAVLAFFNKTLIKNMEKYNKYLYDQLKLINKDIKPPYIEKKGVEGYSYIPSQDILGRIRGEYDEIFDQD